jgi:hypothetical protein
MGAKLQFKSGKVHALYRTLEFDFSQTPIVDPTLAGAVQALGKKQLTLKEDPRFHSCGCGYNYWLPKDCTTILLSRKFWFVYTLDDPLLAIGVCPNCCERAYLLKSYLRKDGQLLWENATSTFLLTGASTLQHYDARSEGDEFTLKSMTPDYFHCERCKYGKAGEILFWSSCLSGTNHTDVIICPECHNIVGSMHID